MSAEQASTPVRQGQPATGWTLLRLWTGIGLQSFGGGASTLLLIRQTFVDRHRLITAEELSRFWSLCQFTPGINLIALTILIGRKLGGSRGMVASVAGMLVPSATVTCLLAAGFTILQHSSAVHAILRGIVPATAGIMLLVAMGYLEPLWRRARQEGGRSIALNALILAGGTLALIVARLPVPLVLVAVAVLGAVIFTQWSRPTPLPPAPDVADDGDSA